MATHCELYTVRNVYTVSSSWRVLFGRPPGGPGSVARSAGRANWAISILHIYD